MGESRRTSGGGRFELLELLGVGGYGEVWDAIDRAREARVAVKRLWNVSADALLRFKREFRIRQDLEHPNLVHAGELVQDGGEWWLTMELVPGTPWITHVGRDPARIARTGIALVGALVALHDRGIVHCDVKPSNVLVTDAERTVLLDLGLVRRIDTITRATAQQAFGTAAYVAPEQAMGDPVSPASDFYALGTSLYEAATGQLPFSGSPVQLVYKKRFELPRSPRELDPNIPEALSSLCMDLLRPQPDARPDARRIVERLVELVDGGQGTAARELRSFPSQRMPFVGRAGELTTLRRALDAVETGSFAFVHVGSESGGGKTSLVRRFLTDVKDDATLVVTGRCLERESVPYNAFDGVVDSLADAFSVLGPAETARLLPSHAFVLTRVFPVLARVPGFQAITVSGGARLASREDVLDVLEELVTKVARGRRLIVFLDDLQWADEESLAAFERLFGRPDVPPMLLVAASRPSNALVPKVSTALARVSENASFVERITLGPLDAEAAGALALAVCDRRLSDETLARIVRGAHGQPLFVAELAETLGRDASLVPTLSVEEAIAARARTLDVEERRVVELLALAAGPLAQEIVADAAGLAYTELSRRLATLRAARFVRTDRVDASLRVEIFHDRVRSAVLGDVHADDRPELQRRLAWAMRAGGIAGSVDLAYLFLEAGASHEAVNELASAAKRAGASLAWSRAARLYFEALCLPGDSSQEEEQSMWFSLASAYANGGEGILAARAYAHASTITTDPSARATLERLASHHFLRSGYADEGRPCVERTLVRIGVALPTTGRAAVAAATVDRARRRAGAPAPDGTTELTVTSLLSLGPPMLFGELPIGARIVQQATVHARALGDERMLAESLAYDAMLEAMRLDGRCTEPLIALEESRLLVGEPPDARLSAVLAMSLGMIEGCAGRLDVARYVLDSASQLLEERVVDASFEMATTRFAFIAVALLGGELDEIRRRLGPWAHDTEQRGDLHGAVLLHVSAGAIGPLLADDPAEAERIVDHTMGRHLQQRFDLAQLVEVWTRLLIGLYRGDAYLLPQVERRLDAMRGGAWHRFAVTRRATRAALAVAALASSYRDAPIADRARTVARRQAERLLAEDAFGRGVGELVLAGLDEQNDRPDLALERLRDAYKVLAGTKQALLRSIVAGRIGALAKGAEAAALRGEALDLWLTQGARRPERWLDGLAGR